MVLLCLKQRQHIAPERQPKSPTQHVVYYEIVCRVCGRDFYAVRFDALKRLSRGDALGYMRELSKRERAKERKWHQRADYQRKVLQQEAADVRRERDGRRLIVAEQRRAKAEAKRKRDEEREERLVEQQEAVEAKARRLWLCAFLVDAIERFEMMEQNFAPADAVEAHRQFVRGILDQDDIGPDEVAAALQPDVISEMRRQVAKARRAAAKAAKAAKARARSPVAQRRLVTRKLRLLEAA
jgi:hypothetical protein